MPAAGIKVVGMGGCGVDYLAQVAAYPRPDEKLRTEKLEVGMGKCSMLKIHSLQAVPRRGGGRGKLWAAHTSHPSPRARCKAAATAATR